MIHYYAFSNFQSFRDRTVVSLAHGLKSAPRRWCRQSDATGEAIGTAAAVFGANAAGKTALLKALAFVDWFAQSSFDFGPHQPIPVTRHFACLSEPSEFEIEFDHDGDLWRYELKVTEERVLHEALYRRKTRFSYVFVRTWDVEREAYEIKQNGFGLKPAEAQKVRANASLISTAAQYGVDIDFAHWVSASNVYVHGRRKIEAPHVENAAAYYASPENAEIKERMIDHLRSWDLGLSSINLVEESVVDSAGRKNRSITTWGVHRIGDEVYELPIQQESSGTQAAFVLLHYILASLHAGKVAVLDEMESDLHPQLLAPIVELFDSEETNPRCAQLLFACHAQQALNWLHKSQAIFVEKNDCMSEAYRGDEIKGLRSDDNLRSKYETGALGAVPRV